MPGFTSLSRSGQVRRKSDRAEGPLDFEQRCQQPLQGKQQTTIRKTWETDKHLQTLLTRGIYATQIKLPQPLHTYMAIMFIYISYHEKKKIPQCVIVCPVQQHRPHGHQNKHFIIFPGHETKESGVKSVILHLKTNHHDDVASNAPCRVFCRPLANLQLN